MRLWALLSAPFRRGPRRPLSARQPERADRSTPLGMEALDLDTVERVNRRNNALERVTGVRASARRSGRFTHVADLTVPPMVDDETYAARYSQAFQNKDVKND